MLRPSPPLALVAVLAACFSEATGDDVTSQTSATASSTTMTSTITTTAEDNTGDPSASATGTASSVTDDPGATSDATSEHGSSGEVESSTGEPAVEPLHCDVCMFYDIEYDEARDACACAPRCPDGICEGGLDCLDGYCGVPCDGDGAECSGDMVCGFMANAEFACMHPGEQPYVYSDGHCAGCAEADKHWDAGVPACVCMPQCESNDDCTWPATCLDVEGPEGRCGIECEGGAPYCPDNTPDVLICVLYEGELQVCSWHGESP